MSEALTKLYPALLAAQQSMGKVKKDAKNPAFRSNYATLQSILETIEGPLWDNGLLVVQQFQYDRIVHGRNDAAGEGTPILITRLVHAASGESIESVVAVSSKDPHDPQKVGSAITYYRRYSLLALLGLTPEEDDDGNSAAQPRQPAAPRQSPAPAYIAAPRPVQAAQQAPQLAQPKWTKEEYAEIVGEAITLCNAYDYERAVSHFGQARARMTPDQIADTKEQLRMMKAAIAERTAR